MAPVAAIGFDVYGTLVDPLGIGDELRKFVGEDAERALVGGHELVKRGGTARELGDGLLEGSQQVLEPGSLDRVLNAGQVQFASGAVTAPGAVVATTRPRMPFTKRPASSPEKVLASSIDSLMAAFVGTWRSIAIS